MYGDFIKDFSSNPEQTVYKLWAAEEGIGSQNVSVRGVLEIAYSKNDSHF